MILTFALLSADPPLVPTPDDARGQLRRELLKPEYYDKNLPQRLLDAISRAIDRIVGSAHGTGPVTWLALTLVGIALVSAVVWLASRARGSTRERSAPGPVLSGERVSASDLRARADHALAEGRLAEAVVEGFRAVAVRSVERGLVDDVPGATAREVAVALRAARPDLSPDPARGATLFDAVHYGDRHPTHEQAADVLALDDALAGAAVRR